MFDNIPDTLRLPGSFIEFSNRLAGNASFNGRLLIIGQRLSTGTVDAGVPTMISSDDLTEDYFGRGSMLAEMCKAAKEAQPWVEIIAIALDDDGAASAATGSLAVTGDATATGTLAIYIGGKRVRVGVTSGDNATTIGDAIAVAINADTSLPVTAANVTGTVTLTSRWNGETANDIDLRLNYYGEQIPAGIAVAPTAMSGGTANPDVATAITAMAGEWYNWIAFPYTDTANLVALEAELDDRYGPMVQMGGRAFTAFAGTLAETSTFGNGRNSPHVSCMGIGTSPSAPYLWSAVNAANGAFHLGLDPARPMQTLQLEGILPPALESRFDDTERNTLLWDGIATYTVSRDGKVQIERQVTMYQLNSGGLPDDSYLDINVPETLERYRFEQRSRIAQRYPRHKLAADDTRVPPGQPVARPKDIRAELLGLYRELEAKGWVQDFEGYKATLQVTIDSGNANRANIYDSPKLVGQMRTVAGHVEFRK